MNRRASHFLFSLVFSLVCSSPAWGASVPELLKVVKSVGPEGQGNVEAGNALRELIQADAAHLPTILRAFHDADPLAANWLRSAVEAIADREIKNGGKLPAADLEKFILHTRHDPRARRLAFEWLVQVDESARERLVPGMLNDPSPEFRRDAVARLIAQAEQLQRNNEPDQAAEVYREALQGAVDNDQVKAIVGPLKKLGHEVDLRRHFGFLTQWQLVGPFDNRDRKGFAVAYPPEEELDLAAKYETEAGEAGWQPLSTKDEYGVFDIAKAISPYKGAVMYAATEFVSPQEQSVELRLGTPNAWKIWLNGKLLFEREEYHRGMALDQYRVRAVMKPGRNVLLLKLCQNEQTDDWAQRYQFQVRVCNSSGSAVLPQSDSRTSRADGN